MLFSAFTIKVNNLFQLTINFLFFNKKKLLNEEILTCEVYLNSIIQDFDKNYLSWIKSTHDFFIISPLYLNKIFNKYSLKLIDDYEFSGDYNALVDSILEIAPPNKTTKNINNSTIYSEKLKEFEENIENLKVNNCIKTCVFNSNLDMKFQEFLNEISNNGKLKFKDFECLKSNNSNLNWPKLPSFNENDFLSYYIFYKLFLFQILIYFSFNI